jgi:hypothetical protein
MSAMPAGCACLSAPLGSSADIELTDSEKIADWRKSWHRVAGERYLRSLRPLYPQHGAISGSPIPNRMHLPAMVPSGSCSANQAMVSVNTMHINA